MQSVRIIDVQKNGNLISVFKEIVEDDGTININQHMFTEDTVEWRAAEYGTRDMDKIIDIILYEPFTDPQEFKSLYAHGSRAEALEEHGRIVSEKKEQVRKRPPTAPVGASLKGPDLAKEKKLDEDDEKQHQEFYGKIKDACLFDEENLEIKTQHIARVFEEKAKEAKEASVPTKRETPRGESLRKLLSKPGKSEA